MSLRDKADIDILDLNKPTVVIWQLEYQRFIIVLTQSQVYCKH